jgi:hypothetical protein
MKSWTLKLLASYLALCLFLPLMAEDEPKKGKKKDALPPQLAGVQAKLADLDLNDDQKKKVEATLAEFAKKYADAAKRATGNLTDEQKNAVRDAMKQAKADGKKGPELKAAAENAVKLDDEQKKARDEGAAELKKLGNDLRASLGEILSAEQLDKLGLKGKKKKE